MMEDNAIRTATETREVGMEEKVSGEDSGGRAKWRRCRITGMDTAAEEMWDGNRGDVEQWIWRNGLEGRRRTRQTSKGNDYQTEGILSL